MEVPLLGKLSQFNRPLPWILGLMAAGLVSVGAITYKLVETPAPQSELEKLTVPAQQETLTLEIKASGTVEPIQSVNISPKTPGLLVKLLAEQGMQVKQGQTLAVMDNAEIYAQGMEAQANFQQAAANFQEAQIRIPEEIKQLEAEVHQGKAALAQARARVSEAQSRLKEARERIPKQIQQAEAQLRSADARFRLAASRVGRNQSLAEEGAISQDRFDEVKKEYLDAGAGVQEALRRLEEAKNTGQPAISQIEQEIGQLSAAVAEAQMAMEQKQLALAQRQKTAQAELGQLRAAAGAAQANVERVKIQYKDSIITAPFDGIVTQKFATEGAFVTPTTSASSTASATSSSILALARGLEVVAKVPEVDVGQLQPGQPVNIFADAYPNEVFQGKVLRVAPEAVVENNVTSFEVTVGLVTGQDKMRSKMNVDVTFLGQPLSNALVVPTVAIVTQEGETGVMVPDAESQPQFKPVTVGLVLDDRAQILSGLTPGERVFIDLPEGYQEGEEER